MKKALVLLCALVLAVSSSVCAFAVNSPSGGTEADKYNIVATIKDGDKVAENADVVIDGGASVKTDKDGKVTVKDITTGKHTVAVTIGSKPAATVEFNIAKGEETKVVKDGNVYNITVKEGIISINVEFVLNAQGALEITAVTPAGNDSPIAPPLGETVPYAIAIVVAISCVAVLALSKKAFVR